ncbi:MAG: hypothetical protein LBP34_03000, partial [Flavobacteriaceae bacterium]|nr:hypothetical protein [Flavobacteriaceae bacterium]
MLYYKDKINQVGILKEPETYGIKNPKTIIDKEREQEYEDFFNKINSQIKENMYFKDSKFSMSKLCVIYDTNSSYVSRAIRTKGYSNFNIYLNTLRINYIKELIKQSDLSKVTLMYIYTEGGFSNQPT